MTVPGARTVDDRDRPDDGTPTHEQGGDPACWLEQVCPACGRLTEPRDDGSCPACGDDIG